MPVASPVAGVASASIARSTVFSFKPLTSLESGLDSNARELLANLYGLKSFRASLTGKVVKVFTDSKNAASISTKGSNSLCLHALALEIFAYCAAYDISLEAE